MEKQNNNFDFNMVEVLRFLLKWKWHIGIITFIAFVAAIVFSGPAFITPKYKSTVIFYPTTNNSISGAILTDATQKEKDVLEFGEEEQAEQALQILGSSALMSKVVQRFDLMNHYNIDPGGSFPYTRLQDQIKKNISFKRTELLSIEITVLDADPEKAAEIANYISDALDSTKTDIQRQVGRKAFEIIEKEYMIKITEVESLQKTINELSSGKDVNTDMLINPFSGKNKKRGTSNALSNQEGFSKGGSNLGTLLSLTEALSLEVEQLNNLKKKYERAKVDIEEYLPQKFVISPASAAEKKAYPIRWLIVILTTAATAVFSVLFIIVFEKFRGYSRLLKEQI